MITVTISEWELIGTLAVMVAAFTLYQVELGQYVRREIKKEIGK